MLPKHTNLAWNQFRTQKVRGVAWLGRGMSFLGMAAAGHVPRTGAYDFGGEAIYVYPYDKVPTFPFFARPCPKTPRHGFVDSRVVKDWQDFVELVEKTYSEDRDAEILMMPYLTAKYSAVVTPTSFVLGQGNAGATGGKNLIAQLSAPKPAGLGNWNVWLSGVANYPNDEVIYLEAVEHYGVMRLVQARPGPMVGSGLSEYIPTDMEVTGVYPLKGEVDLLVWEKWVKGWTGQKGFVVWAPGSSLTSHFAVHCIQNGVAFLTREKVPQVGEKLERAAPKKVTALGRKRFVEEMKRRIEGKLYDGALDPVQHNKTTGVSLSIAHAHSVWGNGELEMRLRAWGIITMLRYTAMACVAEARHFHSSGPGYGGLWDSDDAEANKFEEKWKLDNPGWEIEAFDLALDAWRKERKVLRYRKPQLPWGKGLLDWDIKGEKPERGTVYAGLYSVDLETLMGLLPAAFADLSQPGWKSGMGGTNWANAAAAARDTWAAIQALLQEPSSKNWRTLCEKWNLMAFAVHNGGEILTKWCGDANMYMKYPALGLLVGADMVRKEAEMAPAPVSAPAPAVVEAAPSPDPSELHLVPFEAFTPKVKWKGGVQTYVFPSGEEEIK